MCLLPTVSNDPPAVSAYANPNRHEGPRSDRASISRVSVQLVSVTDLRPAAQAIQLCQIPQSTLNPSAGIAVYGVRNNAAARVGIEKDPAEYTGCFQFGSNLLDGRAIQGVKRHAKLLETTIVPNV